MLSSVADVKHICSQKYFAFVKSIFKTLTWYGNEKPQNLKYEAKTIDGYHDSFLTRNVSNRDSKLKTVWQKIVNTHKKNNLEKLMLFFVERTTS